MAHTIATAIEITIIERQSLLDSLRVDTVDPPSPHLVAVSVVDESCPVRQIVEEIALVGDAVVAVYDGPFALFLAVLVLSLVFEAVAEFVGALAVFLSVSELALIEAVGLR